jgi:hypothetical protein
MQIAILIAVNLLIFVGLPLWFLLFPSQLYAWKHQSKVTSSIGNALQELDRLLTRPSIEYRIEAEDSDKLSQDDQGGD